MEKFAVISVTDNDLYLFSVPLVHFCWQKLGFYTEIIIPRRIKDSEKMKLVYQYTQGAFYRTFTSPIDKEVTYAQCSRLFTADDHDDRDLLVCSDADMLLFNDVFQVENNENYLNILGADLVPSTQYPMCYAYGLSRVWKDAFQMGDKTMQQMLDELLGPIECENFRGNQWSMDQDTLYKNLSTGRVNIATLNRAYPGTQFATKRLDRADGAYELMIRQDTIDCHLWRPGYDPDNFTKIMRVLHFFYPDEDLSWINEYRSKYLEL